MIYVDIRGDLLERGRQMTVGSSKMAIFASFAGYIFRTFTFKATIIIFTIEPLSGSSLTPKRMTLNDLEWSLCVKIWSELGIQCVGVLAFGDKKVQQS